MTLEELQIYKNEIANHRELSQEVMAELFDLAEVTIKSSDDSIYATPEASSGKRAKKIAAPAPADAETPAE